MPFSPPKSAILHQMERIFAVPPFKRSALMRRFFQFVLAESLAGRGSELSQHSIGQHVFDFGSEFDPDRNSVVRVNANRLRRALEKYYAHAGRADSVLIGMPAGGYALAVTYCSELSHRTRLALPAPVLALVEFDGIGLLGSWKQFPLLLVEELSVALGSVSQLRIIGPFRRAMLESRGQQPDSLGRFYPVDFVIGGSVEQVGEHLVIQTRLLKGKSGLEIWSREDRCPLAAPEIAALETSLMRQICTEVFGEFGTMDQHLSSLAKVKPENSLTVFESVLTGRMYYERFDPESLRRGSSCLRRAIAQLPGEPLPRATLAVLLAGACFQPFWQGEAPLAEVAEHANWAYAIDPRSPWAVIALGASAVIHHQPEKLAQLGRLVVADPRAGKLLQGATGVWLLYRNVDTPLGLRLIRQACEGNPHHPPSFHLGDCLAALTQRDWERALRKMDEFGLPGDWRDPLIRGAVAANLDDFSGARQHWQRLLAIYPDFAERGYSHTQRLWHGSYVRLLCESLNRTGASIAM